MNMLFIPNCEIVSICMYHVLMPFCDKWYKRWTSLCSVL